MQSFPVTQNNCVTGMVPTGTGNHGKPGKMGRHFPVREKSGNFVMTGKVREFYSKYWKKLYWKIEKNTGKVREICQPVIVKTLQIWYYTLNKKKLKILENCEKYWKSRRNLSVRKSGNHECYKFNVLQIHVIKGVYLYHIMSEILLPQELWKFCVN